MGGIVVGRHHTPWMARRETTLPAALDAPRTRGRCAPGGAGICGTTGQNGSDRRGRIASPEQWRRCGRGGTASRDQRGDRDARGKSSHEPWKRRGAMIRISYESWSFCKEVWYCTRPAESGVATGGVAGANERGLMPSPIASSPMLTRVLRASVLPDSARSVR